VVMPKDADDAKGPTFIVGREGTCFRLVLLWWDSYRDLGAFTCLADLAAEVRARLMQLTIAAKPASRSIH
jgi:hypothetical protein